jgi:lysosomal alpha-mannosidase
MNKFRYEKSPFRHVNAQQASGSRVNLYYSTPSCYTKSVNDAGTTWPTKTDDFFPYASDPHAYWTGYFSSRPTYKGYIRTTNSMLQVKNFLLTNSGAK